MKHTLSFAIFMLLVLAFLYSISGKKYPQIPADADHLAATDISSCLVCHGPGAIHPRKAAHPPKDDCFQCHKRKRVRKT